MLLLALASIPIPTSSAAAQQIRSHGWRILVELAYAQRFALGRSRLSLPLVIYSWT
jgi:hypothetical protein